MTADAHTDIHASISSTHLLVFTSEASGSIDVRYDNHTISLTQKLTAQLSDVDVRTISEHLRTIYDSEELVAETAIQNFRIVRTEGARQITRGIDHYNLDNAGTIAKKTAEEHALRRFNEYRRTQDTQYVSDFDRFTIEASKATTKGGHDGT